MEPDSSESHPPRPSSRSRLVNWGDGNECHADRQRGLLWPVKARTLVHSTYFLVAACFLVLTGWCVRSYTELPLTNIKAVLPGEFEHHDALLIAFDDILVETHNDELVEVVAKAQKHVEIWLLVANEQQRRRVEAALEQANVALDTVRFLQVPFTCSWVRDYGPMMVKSFDGDYVILDFRYTGGEPDREHPRPADDRVPALLGAELGMRVEGVPLTLDGGDLLSNGAGLCLTTQTLRTENPSLSEERIADLLREHCGAERLVFLEPLQGEPTGHVDMFCAFTAADTVVIGAYDREYDPANSALLDRNARRLAGMRTACGPLKIERIPMPPRTIRGQWRTYANVVFVDGLLLVPTYPGVSPTVEHEAFRTFRRLLPGRQVVGIQAEALMRNDGSLHCATMNVHYAPKGRPPSLHVLERRRM